MSLAVRYDDRLRTVLHQPAERPHDRAVRWRQLVELLARGGKAAEPQLFDQAIAAVRSDAPSVDEQVRTAAARAIAALPAPLELVSAFAADRISVAAPVLAAARLTASEWSEVSNSATPECRRFIASLRAEAGAAEQTPTTGSPVAAAPSLPADQHGGDSAIPSISEVVARIERIRQSRDQGEADAPAADLPAGGEPARLFRWECDQSGEIAWVEGAPRGALIGRSIARGGDGGEVDPRVERAFSQRMPFRDATLELTDGTPVAGSWKISGAPAFDPGSGRFAGYRGVAERESASGGLGLVFPIRDPGSLRELAHEVKTPLTAIIGFAEIISGQYLGPADQKYRERAQEIVAQARLLLTAIDDLDLAAKLQSQRGTPAAADLSAIAERVAAELHAQDLQVEFVVSGWPSCALDPGLAERLVSRFCKAVALASGGEPTLFEIGGNERHCIVSAAKPEAMESDEPSLGMRLVLGLARVAGGDVDTKGERVKLLLPQA